jgi:4-amino-4-deoxy-L-arabinose transferase-like glycosyltransferase
LPPLGVLAVAAFLRLWQLGAVGLNSDEVVYIGSAASLGGDTKLGEMFPIFRAHPLLFQMLESFAVQGHVDDFRARLLPAAVGIATVAITYLLGARMFGRTVGTIAALLLAVMPYHVVVSRQVLLDGLMTLCLTMVLYCIARYADSGRLPWLVAGGATMGLAVLAKETSVVLLGGVYAFFALTPKVRVRLSHLAIAALAMVMCVIPMPLALALSDHESTGQNYLLWQIFRRSNHSTLFYFTAVPAAIGFVLLAAAIGGLLWLRRESTWRERMLLCWIVVPIVFFSLWPVKGYQYLLPIAPALAILAARTIASLRTIMALHRSPRLPRLAVAVAALLAAIAGAVPAWAVVNPVPTTTFLAGSGGLPGGREAGEWVRDNVPEGAQLLAIGPSMANVLQFYGHHRVFALSVSTNPHERNPSYVPVPNPDRALRDGQFQYVVWDSYTAARARFFADKVKALIDKYQGVAVYTGTVTVRANSGTLTVEPVIIIYRVRSS